MTVGATELAQDACRYLVHAAEIECHLCGHRNMYGPKWDWILGSAVSFKAAREGLSCIMVSTFVQSPV